MIKKITSTTFLKWATARVPICLQQGPSKANLLSLRTQVWWMKSQLSFRLSTKYTWFKKQKWLDTLQAILLITILICLHWSINLSPLKVNMSIKQNMEIRSTMKVSHHMTLLSIPLIVLLWVLREIPYLWNLKSNSSTKEYQTPSSSTRKLPI